MRRVIVCVCLLCGVLRVAAHGPIQLAISTNPSSCGQTNGSIVVIPSGGTPPYSFSFDGGPATNSGFLFASGPSTHTVDVKDAAGQTASVSVSVTNDGIPVTLEVLKWTNASGCNASDAAFTLQGVGGTPPYQYSMDSINWQSNPTFLHLPYGSYDFFVRDAAGCATSIIFSTTSCLYFDIGWSVTSCDNSGSISVIVSPQSNNPPYTYSLDGSNYQTNGVFLGLAPGFYVVHIKDGVGSVFFYGLYLVNNCVLTLGAGVQADDCGHHNGMITVAVASGTPPYQYSIDGVHYQSSNIFTSLSAGPYTVTVTDNGGAKQTVDAKITNSGPLIQTIPWIASCAGHDGSLQLSGSGGVSPYQYSIDGNSYFTTGEFDQLSGGQYVAYIKDATGCMNQQTVVVPLNNTVTVNAGPDLALCGGKGVVIGAAVGVPAGDAVSFSWQPSTGLNDAGLLQPTATPGATTAYVLTAMDGDCQRSDTVKVTVLPTPKISAGNDTSVLAGQPVPLQVYDITGNGFTQFVWSPSVGLNNANIPDPIAILQESTTYTVTAWIPASPTDPEVGCSAVSQISIAVYSVSGLFVPSAFTPNGDGHNDILRVKAVGIRQFGYFAVYSRWGQRVFYSTDPGVGWDGFVNGKIQPAGAYVWVASGMDYRGKIMERKGTVMVIR